MKISIITATFNSAANIAGCIGSINEQTHPDIEHIIIDAASKDNTLEIIKSLPNRVTKIISEPDTGIYDAFNKGIQLATGDVVGFLHSDDKLSSPDTIQKIVQIFEKQHNHGLYGDLIFINTGNVVVRTWHSKPFNCKNLKNGWTPPHPTLFLCKEVYQKHGLFNTSFKIAGDYDFMLRVLQDKQLIMVHLPEVITIMRVGGVSTGTSKQLTLKSKEDLQALRNNGFRFPWAVLTAKILRKVPQLFKR
ncbi:MAG: glycosyltransferase [Draconibacterium sp.]|nr:glycosyltransferase [Draconibacterium sp.]